jgi:cold shock CspA family protein|uniref:CSD domain-containing protein n=1 Tax=viral metagenome TaxID=1070528 RepID=A0A6C0H1Y2_9ZZZZ
MSSSDAVEVQSQKMLGQVKWFNNKAGYGFITVSDGEFANKDIFIHYTSIRVTNSQYKYLVQGEYVEFNLVKSANDKHEYQATEVSGIKGGSLMCETRRTFRTAEDGVSPRPARGARTLREGGADRPRRPRESPSTGDEFTQVRRRKPVGSKRDAPLDA